MRRKLILFPALVFILFTLTSCWNYREVNEMAIVIGAALDKGLTNNYMLTVELLDVSDERRHKYQQRFCQLKVKRCLML